MIKKISYIVTSYNHEKYIFDSLSSIENQSVRVDELVISDDASTDKTKEIIQKFIEKSKIPKIIFLNGIKNIGIVKNFNKAIRSGTNEILILQAGDDLSSLDRTLKTLEYFKTDTCNSIYSSYSIIDEKSNWIKNIFRRGSVTDPLYFIKKGSAIPPFGIAVKKDLIDRLPEPYENIKNDDDYFAMYLVLNGGIEICPQILYKYRVHSLSASSWYNKGSDNLFLDNFLSDQENRILNLMSWKSLINKNYNNYSESKINNINHIIDKKIEIKNIIKNIKYVNIFYRSLIILNNFKYFNLQEIIIFIFGKNGILLIKKSRNILMKIKK